MKKLSFILIFIFCSFKLFSFSNEAVIEAVNLIKKELPKTSTKEIKIEFTDKINSKYQGQASYNGSFLLIEFNPNTSYLSDNKEYVMLGGLLDVITHELAHCEWFLMNKSGDIHGKDFERIRFALYRKAVDNYLSGIYNETLFIKEYKTFHENNPFIDYKVNLPYETNEKVIKDRYDDQTLMITNPKAKIKTTDKLYLEIYNFKKED